MNKKIDFILTFLIGFVVIFMAIYISFSVNFADSFEHILSSWNVSEGKVPYRDFFQHHHALLWYLFAPIVKVFDYYNSALILFFARFIGLSATLLTAYFLFKIERRFIKIPHAGYLAVLLFLTNDIVHIHSVMFRPDNFMLLTAVIGIYYYLTYFEVPKTRNLVYSFLLFFISFMFLQKVIPFLFVVGIVSAIFTFKGKMKFKDLVMASLIPLFLYVSYLLYLYSNGSLARYWELNFMLNIYINSVHYRFIGFFSLIFFIFSIVSSILIIKLKHSIYFDIISYFFLFSFLLTTLTGAPLEYYYLLPVALGSLCSSYGVLLFIKNMKTYRFGKIFLLQMLLFSMCYPIAFILLLNTGAFPTNVLPITEYKISQFVLDNSSKEDIIFNGDYNRIGLFRGNVHPYYIFSLMTVAPKDTGFFDYVEKFEITDLIKQNKPKIMVLSWPLNAIEKGMVPADETYQDNGASFHLKLDEETLGQYEKIPELNLYLLKQ